MPDRRHFIRWQIDKQARIKLEDAPAFTNCQIVDISLKGIQISLSQKLKKDKFLKLNLVLSEECSIYVEVWVTWHKTIDGFNLYGLYFNKIRDIDKEGIYQFIRRYFPEEINKQWWKDIVEEKGGKMEDRRIFARFTAEFPLRFLDLVGNREGLAKTVDISAKGIGIESNQELAPNAPLEMWLNIPDHHEPLYSRGEVVWSKAEGIDRYRAGINLDKADLMGLSRVLRVA